MSSLEIRVGNVVVMSRQLARMSMAAENLTPALDEVARLLVDANKQNFASEGASGPHGRWAPLSPAYRVWKEKHFPGKPILVRTGRLRDSLTHYPMDVQRTTNRSLLLGTGVPYAQYHQSGGRNLPMRQPVALDEQQRRQMMKVIQKWVVSGRV